LWQYKGDEIITKNKWIIGEILENKNAVLHRQLVQQNIRIKNC